MKFELENFGAFLKDCITPIANYARIGALIEPVITIEALKKEVVVTCAQHNRVAATRFPAPVKKKGMCHIMANTLTALKSGHKKVLLENVDAKLVVTGSSGNRDLEIAMDTVGKTIATNIKTEGKTTKVTLSSATIKKVLNSVSINPITGPSREEAYLSIFLEKKKLVFIVQDSTRLVVHRIKTKLKKFPEITTSLSEIQAVLSVAESLSDDVEFKFSKKAIEIIGSNDGDENTYTKANYSAPNEFMLQRAQAAIQMFKKQPVKASFKVNDSFKEVLESLVSLTTIRTKQAHIDIKLMKRKMVIKGLGPLSSYKESISFKPKGKPCSIRVASNVLIDITKHFEIDETLFEINPKGITVTTKEKKKETIFLVPILGFSDGKGN